MVPPPPPPLLTPHFTTTSKSLISSRNREVSKHQRTFRSSRTLFASALISAFLPLSAAWSQAPIISCDGATGNCKIFTGDTSTLSRIHYFGWNSYGRASSALKSFGYTTGGAVSGNTVIVKASGIEKIIRGAVARTAAEMKNNRVIIALDEDTNLLGATADSQGEGSQAGGFICAAAAWEGSGSTMTMSGNEVYITGGTVSGGSVIGANFNHDGDSYGGSYDLEKTIFSKNTVTFEETTFNIRGSDYTLIAGASEAWTNSENDAITFEENEVRILNSTVSASEIAASIVYSLPWSGEMVATGNKVTISDSKVNVVAHHDGGGVYAGIAYSLDGDGEKDIASGNTVEISDSQIFWTADADGSFYSLSSVTGGGSDSNGGKIRENGVTLTNVTLDAKLADGSYSPTSGLTIYGARFNGTTNDVVTNSEMSGNWLRILGESNLDGVKGLYGVFEGMTGAVAKDNRVEILGNSEDSLVSFNSALDLGMSVMGAYPSRGTAQANQVTIQYASLGDKTNNQRSLIAGGYVLLGSGDSKDNAVTISHSIIDNARVIGGFSAGGSATGNIVTIGESVVSSNSEKLILSGLLGGWAGTSASGIVQQYDVVQQYASAFKGNTLNLHSHVQTDVLSGFQNYNFFVTAGDVNSGTALITTTDAERGVLLASSDDASQKTHISINGTGLNAAKNDEIVLISSAAGFVNQEGNLWQAKDNDSDLTGLQTDLDIVTLSSVARQTRSEIKASDYGLEIRDVGTIADLTQNHEQQLVAVLGKAETRSMVNDQTDSLMESSLTALATAFSADDLFVDAALRSHNTQREGVFAATRAGTYEYDSKSNLESTIVSGLLGFSAPLGKSNVGAFLEMGHASYKSNLKASLGDVIGKGSHDYAGGGFFVDYPLPVEGLRLTSYIKGGVLDNDFRAHIADISASYDKLTAYWGAHLGTQYDIDMPSIRTRFFLSYFYDARESETYDIIGSDQTAGAHVKADSLNAHRIQVGSLVEFKMHELLRPYLGVTFEQVISAKAKGSATDYAGTLRLNSSDLEGSTGIMSAGWVYQNESGSFACEFGFNGYIGTRNGVSGQLQGLWKF